MTNGVAVAAALNRRGCLSRWPDDAQQQPVQIAGGFQRFMNAQGQCGGFVIPRAGDDSSVLAGGVAMQPEEITPVESQHRPHLRSGEFQNFGVGHLLVCAACFQRGEDVVSLCAKFPHDSQRKVFVCVKAGRHRYQASLFSLIARSTSSGWSLTCSHAAARSAAVRPG